MFGLLNTGAFYHIHHIGCSLHLLLVLPEEWGFLKEGWISEGLKIWKLRCNLILVSTIRANCSSCYPIAFLIFYHMFQFDVPLPHHFIILYSHQHICKASITHLLHSYWDISKHRFGWALRYLMSNSHYQLVYSSNLEILWNSELNSKFTAKFICKTFQGSFLQSFFFLKTVVNSLIVFRENIPFHFFYKFILSVNFNESFLKSLNAHSQLMNCCLTIYSKKLPQIS